MLLRNVHAEPTVARIHIVLGLSDRLLGACAHCVTDSDYHDVGGVEYEPCTDLYTGE